MVKFKHKNSYLINVAFYYNNHKQSYMLLNVQSLIHLLIWHYKSHH